MQVLQDVEDYHQYVYYTCMISIIILCPQAHSHRKKNWKTGSVRLSLGTRLQCWCILYGGKPQPPAHVHVFDEHACSPLMIPLFINAFARWLFSQTISSKSHVIVATHQIEICSNEEKEEENNVTSTSSLLETSTCSSQQQQLVSVLLVSLTSEDGSTVYTVPLRLDNTQTNLLWTPLSCLVSPSTKMTRYTNNCVWLLDLLRDSSRII